MSEQIKKPWEHPNFRKIVMKCEPNQLNKIKDKLECLGWKFNETYLKEWMYIQNHEKNYGHFDTRIPYVIAFCPYEERVGDEMVWQSWNEDIFLKYCGYEEPKIKNADNPAFTISGDLIDRCGQVDFSPFGLTKREYIATNILQGMISIPNTGLAMDGFISKSVKMADALLKELEK